MVPPDWSAAYDPDMPRRVFPLSPAYRQLVLDGKKTSTVRRGRLNIATGSGRFTFRRYDDVHIEIVGFEYVSSARLTDALAQADGFADRAELRSALQRFYPDIKPHEPLTVIHFYLNESGKQRGARSSIR